MFTRPVFFVPSAGSTTGGLLAALVCAWPSVAQSANDITVEPPSAEATTDSAGESQETSAAEQAPAATSDEKEQKAAKKSHPPRKLPTVQLPKFGATQAWIRNSSYVDYFRDNYDVLGVVPYTSNDRFLAVVNYASFGTETRFKSWTFATSVRVDTVQNFNLKSQPLCDRNNNGSIDGNDLQECRYFVDPANPKRWDKRLERLTLRANSKYFDLTIGDFNVNFGRGLGLTVRKVNEITVDASIKGARLDLKSKRVVATGLFGVGNRQQSDYVTRTLYADPGYPHILCRYMLPGFEAFHRDPLGNRLWTSCSDVVGGVRIDSKLPGKINLGAHYSNIWFGQLDGTKHEAMHVIGGDIARSRIAKKWDVFAGMTTVLRNYHLSRTDPSRVKTGYGAYLSNNISLGNASLLIEGKYYEKFLLAKEANPYTVQYGQAPTLEREDQQIPANANSAGGRVRLDYNLPKLGMTVHGNFLGYAYAESDSHSMFRGEEAYMTLHGYTGLRWRDDRRGTSINTSVGYRWQGHRFAPQDSTASRYKRKLPHLDFYINQPISRAGGFEHSINFQAFWRYEEQSIGNTFHKGNLNLGYSMAPFLAITFMGGFSSEFAPLLNEPKLQAKPCPDGNCRRTPHFWPGLDIRAFLTSASSIRVLIGRQVGGLICANGSCRIMPDFEGVRGELVLEF